ncbi:MAG TPA: tripartite tricarboxylate transporter substrate-binding protein [Xanthobacteraceae bacterium]|nr:tripartite tricarboxylate transporter substrate-binding protein [Xanthobacteraceae bacterium]
MISKRDLLKNSGAAALCVAMIPPERAWAQAINQLQLFVPAAPGGGWDQTARVIELVLKQEKLISSAQITNVPGAGGAVGLPQFVNQWRNRPNTLMIGGMVMIGALIANKAPVKVTQTVPIARLTGEFEVLVVPANSSLKSAQEFAAAMKADPTKVSVAGGSAGGTDHIMLAMIGKALGVAPKDLKYVAYSGGGPALAAILGGHVTAGISGYGEFGEQIKAGKLRALAISAGERQPDIDVPTLKEQGIEVELANWRGVFAPPGAAGAQRQALLDLIEKMIASDSWKQELQKRDWTSIPLLGDAYAKFIEDESTRIEAILKDLGLAA